MNKGLVYAILAAVLGGSVPVLSKFGLTAFPPFVMHSLRFFSASLVFIPFMMNRTKILWNKEVFVTSLIAALNPILFIIAMSMTKASVAPLIYASVPMMVALYGSFHGEKLSTRRWAGVLIGFSGVALTVLLPLFVGSSQNAGSFIGNFLIFLAAIVFFIYTQLSKKLQDKGIISPVELTFAFTAVTFLVTIPLGVYDLWNRTDFSQIHLIHIIVGFATGMVGTSLFYLVYQKSIKLGSTLSASLFVFLQPLATAALAALVLGEQITMPLIIGGVLAIVGAKIASGR